MQIQGTAANRGIIEERRYKIILNNQPSTYTYTALSDSQIVKATRAAECRKCGEVIIKGLYKYKSETGYSICLICAKKEAKQLLKEIIKRSIKDYEVKLKGTRFLMNFK
jgi:formylmethanofuran dehydrogenase subunit E